MLPGPRLGDTIALGPFLAWSLAAAINGERFKLVVAVAAIGAATPSTNLSKADLFRHLPRTALGPAACKGISPGIMRGAGGRFAHSIEQAKGLV